MVNLSLVDNVLILPLEQIIVSGVRPEGELLQGQCYELAFTNLFLLYLLK